MSNAFDIDEVELLERIERFMRDSTSVLAYEDWDYDGEQLTVFCENDAVEKYSKDDIYEILEIA